MDERAIETTIKNYISLLPINYKPLKVFLFGSFARNNFREESDIDVALVFRDVKDSFQTQVDLMKLRRTVDLRIEPHPIAEKDFIENNPLAKEVIKYGKEIIL